MDELIETAELAAFTHIVDAGSLSRASMVLGVPRATIGRRLERLEQRLGARLVRRTTRKLVLTEEGRALYTQAQIALTAVRDAVLCVRQADGAVRGRLRVSAPPMADGSFDTLVREFLAAYPDVVLELTFTTAAVDFGDSGYDLAIRASSQLDPGLVRRHLADTRLVVVGAPDYLARAGMPRTPDELTKHACIVGYVGGQTPARDWPLRAGGSVRVSGPLATNEIRLQLEMAGAGMGLAMVPETLAAVAITAGALVPVLLEEVGVTATVAVVYPERRLLRPVVRAFIDHVVRWAETELPKVAARCERAVAERQAKAPITIPPRSKLRRRA